MFESQLVVEVQSRCINHGEKKAVVLGLAYFDTGTVDAIRPFGWTSEESLEIRSLFGSGGGRDFGCLEEQPQK